MNGGTRTTGTILSRDDPQLSFCVVKVAETSPAYTGASGTCRHSRPESRQLVHLGSAAVQLPAGLSTAPPGTFPAVPLLDRNACGTGVPVIVSWCIATRGALTKRCELSSRSVFSVWSRAGGTWCDLEQLCHTRFRWAWWNSRRW